MQPNFQSNNLIELCVCWCFWIFGTLLDKLCSTQIFISNKLLSIDILSIMGSSNWGDVAFRTLQVISFIVAIIVGIVNLLKNFGYDVKIKKPFLKKKK